VSVYTDGSEFNDGSFVPSISDDGRYVAMQSYRGNDYGGYGYGKILVYDRQTGTSTEVLTVSGSDPHDRETRQEPALSGDGRFVAFHLYN
jgi:Tol biopolymer transport system component